MTFLPKYERDESQDKIKLSCASEATSIEQNCLEETLERRQ